MSDLPSTLLLVTATNLQLADVQTKADAVQIQMTVGAGLALFGALITDRPPT